MPKRNTAEAAYAPAIAALTAELSDLARRASDTRTLIKALSARAVIAGEPAAAPGEAAVPPSRDTRSSLIPKISEPSGRPSLVPKTSEPEERTYTTKHGAKPKTTAAPAKPNDDKASAAELSKVVAAIAGASAEVQSATRAKDADKLSAAISARAKAERVAGKLLVALSGRLRPLPISKVQSKKYRRDAELSAEEFEAKLRRAQRRALAEIGAPFAMLDAIGAAPAKPQGARPTHAAPPKVTMKIGDWREEPDGTRSRLLTNEVEDGGQVAGLPS